MPIDELLYSISERQPVGISLSQAPNSYSHIYVGSLKKDAVPTHANFKTFSC
jgi:hypothetical protein